MDTKERDGLLHTITQLIKAVGLASHWASRVSDELLDGEDSRGQYCEDIDEAEEITVKAMELVSAYEEGSDA